MGTNYTSEPWEQSLAQVRRVNPNPKLFQRIQNAIPSHEKVSNLTVWLVAASLIALFAVNYLIVQNNTTIKDSKVTFVDSSLNQTNQLYY